MRERRKQEGFSILWAVLVALVVIAAACAGWLVYQRNGAMTADTKTNTNQQQPTHQQPRPTPTTEFVVAELGFKMQLPSGLTGLKYVIDNSIPDYPTAYFTTASLEQADGGNTQCTAAEHPLGAISKTSDNPATSGVHYAMYMAVGSFYLTYTTPQQGCSSNSSTVSLETSQTALLRQAFNTAEPSN